MDTTLSAPIGQLLDGRYLVESQLARGGMATVYLGRDVRLDRTVALKIAHPELARDQEFVARFISEARSVARLSSPNVVSVFDQGSTGDLHYIAMEYVPGPTLRELLVARGRLNPREALDIIERVLAGLSVAHDAGIIHRDVKPENVLLGNGTSVKVADFGLARAAAGISHTRTGLLIGTAAYLAPEQVASNSSDARTDVYAAGVMLFEMVTGFQPHTGDTPLAVAYKHVNAVVPAPSSVIADLPVALDALVALGTSRDPELRPSDARHYLRAITEVRRGMPLPARPGPGETDADAAAENGTSYRSQPLNSGPARVSGSHSEAMRVTAPDTGRLGPAAYSDPYGSQHRSGSSPNHTMIVPTGIESDYGDAAHYPDYRGGHGRRYRRPHEPFLQRWLFSRRIIIVVAAVLALVLGWWLFDGQYFSLPPVAGMTQVAARSELSNLGLKVVKGQARYSDTVPAGHVISTDPAVGTRMTHGSKVTVVDSLGPVMVRMPAVTGQPLAQAEKMLQDAGLKWSTPQPAASTSVPPGDVISTSPSAYQSWPKDKPVTILVCEGQPVPNFVGAPLAAAQAAAQAGGYIIQAPSGAQPGDTISAQNPAPGAPIGSGGVVTVQVSAQSSGQPVDVPNVDGMSPDQAAQTLRGAGFQVKVNDVGIGNLVTDYNPKSAPPGSVITIDVGLSI